MTGTQKLWLDVGPDDWLLTNHRNHFHKTGAIVKRIRAQAGWTAKTMLRPVAGPVSIYARAHIPKGVLPDADAIAPMIKAAIDGIVDARILVDDKPEHVLSTTYMAPIRDRNLTLRRLEIIITNQHVPF